MSWKGRSGDCRPPSADPLAASEDVGGTDLREMRSRDWLLRAIARGGVGMSCGLSFSSEPRSGGSCVDGGGDWW